MLWHYHDVKTRLNDLIKFLWLSYKNINFKYLNIGHLTSLYESLLKLLRKQTDKLLNFNIKRTLMSSLLSSREQCLDLANEIGKTCRICGGENQGDLLKSINKKIGTREPINRCIIYSCSFLSNTLFIRKQNDWRLYVVFFSNGF